MDKKIYNAVSGNADGYCQVCGTYCGDGLELHHILRRKVIADKNNCLMLCVSCHRLTNGVHGKNGHILDLELKVGLQHKYFKLGYTEDEVRKLMNGRLYFKGE